jgi:hypothetical protein
MYENKGRIGLIRVLCRFRQDRCREYLNPAEGAIRYLIPYNEYLSGILNLTRPPAGHGERGRLNESAKAERI